MFTIPAYFDDFRPLADKTVKIVYITEREPTNEELAAIMLHFRKRGSLGFKESGRIEQDDLAPLPKAAGKQSKAQRYRNVLYRVWESNGSVGDFEDFYDNKMELDIAREKENIRND